MPEKLTILISLQIDENTLSKIRQICPGCEIRVGPWITDAKQTMDTRLMKGANVLLCEVPPANFEDFDCLKLMQFTSHGYSQVAGLPILERGIRVCNGLGVFDTPIAEWCIAMMINLCRDVRGMIRNQEAGFWEPADRFQREIHGSIVGFFGYGGIARATARLAKTCGMTVYALNTQRIGPRKNTYIVPGTGDPEGVLPDRTFKPGQEIEFLCDLDFLVMSVPLTKHTKGIIGEKHLKALPRHACVLNPSRGPLIQEEALLKALREQWISAVALDTHYYYPMPADHPLWRFPNVIMTPHISGSSACQSFMKRIYDIFTQNLHCYSSNKPLLNELTESQIREG